MSEAPRSTALQLLDGSARILLDVAAVAAKEHRERIPAPVTAEADQASFALQAVLRQAHGDGMADDHLFQALTATVAMFMGNQRLTPDGDYFLAAFQTAVRLNLPPQPQPRPN